jgi:Ca-activated chloride channel homolog
VRGDKATTSPSPKNLATEHTPPHRGQMLRVALFVCLLTSPAISCETALVLSIDVSGSIDGGDYRLQLSWQRMLAPDDVALFAARAAAMPRAFTGSDTAVGQGLRFAQGQFTAVPDCRRKVIDVSGDGQENAGFTDAKARAEAIEADVMINAIAIEEPGPAFPITNYYRNWVITPGGFVVSARGLQDYAETLRLKLLRELVKPIG